MEEARKLLDNGWKVTLFRDGLGQYSAMAVPTGKSSDMAMIEWAEYDSDPCDSDDVVFGGPNRYCGCGWSIEDALKALTEKVLFRRLPAAQDAAGEA